MRNVYSAALLFLLIIGSFTGCKKETVIVTDNDPPYYDGISTARVQNFVNRIYIDLIGREPLDIEMDADVAYLRENSLSEAARDSLLRKLQFNRDYVEGDSSYSLAYYHRFYDLSKTRLIEGASNDYIHQQIGILNNGILVDSLSGDSAGVEKKRARRQKYLDILDSELDYYHDSIPVNEMYRRMIDNPIYDEINMNTFNFVNATFNDLFFRYPSQNEFDIAFDMIEFDIPGSIFLQSGSNKGDYMEIVVTSNEFYEGMIRWAYITLLAREPSTTEISEVIDDFYQTGDFQKVQRAVMVTDEYANF